VGGLGTSCTWCQTLSSKDLGVINSNFDQLSTLLIEIECILNTRLVEDVTLVVSVIPLT